MALRHVLEYGFVGFVEFHHFPPLMDMRCHPGLSLRAFLSLMSCQSVSMLNRVFLADCAGDGVNYGFVSHVIYPD